METWPSFGTPREEGVGLALSETFEVRGWVVSSISGPKTGPHTPVRKISLQRLLTFLSKLENTCRQFSQPQTGSTCGRGWVRWLHVLPGSSLCLEGFCVSSSPAGASSFPELCVCPLRSHWNPLVLTPCLLQYLCIS